MKKQFLFVLVAAVAIMASFNAEALTFNPFKRAGRVRANTLILSGNYVQSRLLADLAQYYSKQPVLLLSPDVDGAYQLFYLPSGNTATPVNADDFMTIVEYGVAIADVAANVQKSVKDAVETMTGLNCPTVNVHIQGVTFPEGAPTAKAED